MRCRACGRRLLEAAYTHASGWVLGPTCYKKERDAGRLPHPSHFPGRPKPKKEKSKRVKIKRIKRTAQVQDDLFSQGVENVGEVD